ncbi:hypothetical protein AAG570_009406 [Ranatra chinensis]|uniref:RING-type E3 ubiquitin transferase n=1 Tax=Ranatra chinensis TaxID=642074 RepID=A0ABD0YP87_9HEMI
MAEASNDETKGAVESLSSGTLTLKQEKLERPDSPDISCSICLEELRNKSFTDTCIHQFCFSCLLQWSKIKAECPLCKQKFQNIYYNIKPSGLCDVMEINASPVMAPVPDVEPTVLINLAFDRPRFRYRSTLSRAMLYIGNVLGSYRPSSARVMTSDYRRRRQLGTSEFRRNIYRQGLWFSRSLRRYLGVRTPHFIHEFYSYATSPYDMRAYDVHAEYSSVDNIDDSNHFDANRQGTTDDGDDSDIEVVLESPPAPVPSSLIDVPVDLSVVAGPSYHNGNGNRMLGTEDAPIVISDQSDDNSTLSSITLPRLENDNNGHISDSSVEFLTAIPPPHLRTPETITLCSGDSADESSRNAGNRAQPHVNIAPSPSFSASNRDVVENEGRTHNTRKKMRKSGRASLVRYSYSSSEESDRKPKRRKSTRTKNKSSKNLKKRRDDTSSSSSQRAKGSRKQKSKPEYDTSDSDYEPTPAAKRYRPYSKRAQLELAKLPPRLRLKSVVKVVNSDSSEIPPMESSHSGSSRRKNAKKYYSSSTSDRDYNPCGSRRVEPAVRYYESSTVSNSEDDYY